MDSAGTSGLDPRASPGERTLLRHLSSAAPSKNALSGARPLGEAGVQASLGCLMDQGLAILLWSKASFPGPVPPDSISPPSRPGST